MKNETIELLIKILNAGVKVLEDNIELAPEMPDEGLKETPKPPVEKKRGRPKKETKVENDFDEDEEEEEVEPIGSPDEDDDFEDPEEEEEEEEEGLTEEDLLKIKSALNKYSAKYGREMAVKSLKKHAPTVTKLNAAKMKKLLKEIAV